MSNALRLELVDDESSSGRPKGDEVDGVSTDQGVEGSENDDANEAPIDVGFDTDDDGDSATDSYSSDEEE